MFLEHLLVVDRLPGGTPVQGRGVGLTRVSYRRLVRSRLLEHAFVLRQIFSKSSGLEGGEMVP